MKNHKKERSDTVNFWAEINDFQKKSEMYKGSQKNAITTIVCYLKGLAHAANLPNPPAIFVIEDEDEDVFDGFQDYLEKKPINSLDTDLNILQYTSGSLYNSALNLITLAFLSLSIVGLPALWLAGVLKRNYEKTGDSLMFFAYGEKQEAKKIIHKLEQAAKITDSPTQDDDDEKKPLLDNN